MYIDNDYVMVGTNGKNGKNVPRFLARVPLARVPRQAVLFFDIWRPGVAPGSILSTDLDLCAQAGVKEHQFVPGGFRLEGDYGLGRRGQRGLRLPRAWEYPPSEDLAHIKLPLLLQ